jgi:hypothetical protein
MIGKRITGVFAMREGGQQAAQALLQHNIAPEWLYMRAGAPVAAEQHNDRHVPCCCRRKAWLRVPSG